MKKKIVFFMTRYYTGGTEKIVINLINNLNKSLYDITLITLTNDGGLENTLDSHINKRYLFNKYFRGLEYILNKIPAKLLYKILVKDEYDVEISIGDGLCSKIIRASCNKVSKKICWIHTDVLKRGNNLREFKTSKDRERFFESFNHIVCVSKDSQKSFIEKFGNKDKVIVKYNPIDLKDIEKKSVDEFQSPYDNNQLNILSVGRLSEPKGYDRLIKVHKRLLEEGLFHHMYIVGDGELEGMLKKMINDMEIEKSFRLLGHQSNPYPYIKHADLFVCSSRDEAFSTVLCESLILGTPIISTKCSGTIELLGDSKYGLVTKNDEADLYEGLKTLIKNQKIIEEYKFKMIERKSFFNFEKSIEEWEKIFN